MKKDKQVNMEKTSFLKLNSTNISCRNTKKPLSISLRNVFFFCSKTHNTILGQSVAVCSEKKL